MRSGIDVRVRVACLHVLVLLALSAAAPSHAREDVSGTGTRGDRVRIDLAPGKSTTVEVLGLEQATVFEIFCEGERVALLLEPDGVVQFIGVGAEVDVSVTGTRGDRMQFSLGSTEQVSIWPIRRLKIRREADRFTLEAEAAHWAFAVSAHRAREAGLAVSCNDIPSNIRAGERLDVGRERGELAFRVIRDVWPGQLVRAEPVPTEPARPFKPPEMIRPYREVGKLPPLPFVLAGWGAWEIRPPPVASP